MSWWNDVNWLGQPQDAYANMAEDLVNAVNERLNFQFPGYQLPTVADFKELRRDAAWLPAIIKELQDTVEVMLSPTKSYSSFLWTTPTAYADEAAQGPPPPWTLPDWRVHTALYGCLQWDELLAAIEVVTNGCHMGSCSPILFLRAHRKVRWPCSAHGTAAARR